MLYVWSFFVMQHDGLCAGKHTYKRSSLLKANMDEELKLQEREMHTIKLNTQTKSICPVQAESNYRVCQRLKI